MMGNEVLIIVDAVSREKGVDKEIIFQALEAALHLARVDLGLGDVGGVLDDRDRQRLAHAVSPSAAR